MNRPTVPQLLRLAVLASFVLILSGATAKPVHPPSLGTGGPILIAIVGDHYSATEEDEFNYDVDNFIKRGLLIDSYFKDRKDDWRFVSYFEPTDAGKESHYGFKIGFGDGNCAVMDNQDPAKTTMELLGAAVGSDVPRHTIVLGNHPYNFGCAKGGWSYLAVGAVGTDILQHEFGHRFGYLWDEWFSNAAPARTTPAAAPYYPPTWSAADTRNCWPVGPSELPAHWTVSTNPVFSNTTNRPGCDLVSSGVIHPYDHCRMGASHMRMFCDVCKAELDRSFIELITLAGTYTGGTADASLPDPLRLRASHAPQRDGFGIVNAAFALERQQQPAAPTTEPKPVLKVVMRYNPATRAVTVRQTANGTGPYVPNYRRVGQYLYEIRDGLEIVDVGVIPDQAFQVHGSRGGAPHATAKLDDVELVVMIPGKTVESLSARPLQVRFYRIPARVTDRLITKASFSKLREAGGFENWGEMTLAASK